MVLLALVEQATAKKDRSKRPQCHAAAFDYCTLANLLEPGNPQTLNMLANHHFHTWRAVEFTAGAGCVVDEQHLMLPAQAAPELVVPRNLLRLKRDGTNFVFTIGAVTPTATEGADAADYVTVAVTPRIPARFLSADGGAAPCSSIEVKDLASVEKLAHQAMLRATVPALVAESNYILGKVAHSLRDATLAFDFYWKALKDAPDMTLAAFGAAEILYSKKEFQASLELFEKVLLQSPEDKDTQAYVILLKATLRKELAPFDKLREIAPGFQHEADLWLLQGQLRQHDPAEHKHALKCFLNAKDCLDQRAGAGAQGGSVVPAAVLSNISVLHHSLGKPQKALEFSRLTLLAVHAQAAADKPPQQTLFRSSELEGVFYNWSTPVCTVTQGAEAGVFQLVDGAAVDLTQLLAVGDEVVIGGVKHTVQKVASASEVQCSSPVKLPRGDGNALELSIKVALNNFVDESLTYCFNFARLLEDEGHTAAATEVYVELLKRHPSYMECKSVVCEQGILLLSADEAGHVFTICLQAT
jgi:tetratricopeptide (TPR) repeat protein